MQICAPLTRSQCKVSDIQVTVRPVGLLFNLSLDHLMKSKHFFFMLVIFLKIQFAVPAQPSDITVHSSTSELQINWSHSIGNVESYNVTADCICNCNETISHKGNETVAHVRGLVAGTHCNVTIIAISGGLPSNPLFKADIETEEKSMIL